jgi:2-keto-3-deoxy-L-rhamnonate aldolase RhmA
MPKVETAAQARLLAACCRFPPAGSRSMIARLPQDGFARLPAAELIAAANARTVVQALIESPLGVGNADAIAAVDGIDMLAIGANDLSAEMGRPGDTRHPAFREACAAVAEAARLHGKVAVIGGIGDHDQFAELLDLGFAPLIFAGIDTDIIVDGLATRCTDWRARMAARAAREGDALP